jgi:hypothetical protein
MREKVKFVCGVYIKEVLRQLGLKTRVGLMDATECTDSEPPPPARRRARVTLALTLLTLD